MSTLRLTPQDLSCVRKAYQLITSDTTKQYTIPGLAAELGLNRNKLQVGFKELYGTTLYDFQQQIKLKKAEELLLQSDKTIMEIASLSGYTDKSSLNKSFRKRYGMSPHSWRNKYASNLPNPNSIDEPF